MLDGAASSMSIFAFEELAEPFWHFLFSMQKGWLRQPSFSFIITLSRILDHVRVGNTTHADRWRSSMSIFAFEELAVPFWNFLFSMKQGWLHQPSFSFIIAWSRILDHVRVRNTTHAGRWRSMSILAFEELAVPFWHFLLSVQQGWLHQPSFWFIIECWSRILDHVRVGNTHAGQWRSMSILAFEESVVHDRSRLALVVEYSTMATWAMVALAGGTIWWLHLHPSRHSWSYLFGFAISASEVETLDYLFGVSLGLVW